MQRRLATIMAADVVGYSARMGKSETETLRQLADLAALMERHVSRGGGRIFARAADGFLAEFQSPVSSVQAAYQIQRELKTSAEDQANGLELRIGIHLGDVIDQVTALYRAGERSRRWSLRVSGELGRAAAIGPDALKQVLLNLLENAREAMTEGGTIELRLADEGELPGPVRRSDEDRRRFLGRGSIEVGRQLDAVGHGDEHRLSRGCDVDAEPGQTGQRYEQEGREPSTSHLVLSSGAPLRSEAASPSCRNSRIVSPKCSPTRRA